MSIALYPAQVKALYPVFVDTLKTAKTKKLPAEQATAAAVAAFIAAAQKLPIEKIDGEKRVTSSNKEFFARLPLAAEKAIKVKPAARADTFAAAYVALCKGDTFSAAYTARKQAENALRHTLRAAAADYATAVSGKPAASKASKPASKPAASKAANAAAASKKAASKASRAAASADDTASKAASKPAADTAPASVEKVVKA